MNEGHKFWKSLGVDTKKATTQEGVKPPECFSRAVNGGMVFDNCRYIHVCKDVKLICGNNPIK